ncbi:axoneme-associated protein mst101(2)-like [Drosophila sulfurigaster albostrigata]|uniref:axoneme-associated protein mst101(2)-like n=1 Tax=Drosophila sulfurigaster albostrigata TaxID=89887 RepID=UPI002D219844|nr:axoneme-associated protein mst101(2)-like [Drosophila sulfurigaster albostrigata]
MSISRIAEIFFRKSLLKGFSLLSNSMDRMYLSNTTLRSIHRISLRHKSNNDTSDKKKRNSCDEYKTVLEKRSSNKKHREDIIRRRKEKKLLKTYEKTCINDELKTWMKQFKRLTKNDDSVMKDLMICVTKGIKLACRKLAKRKLRLEKDREEHCKLLANSAIIKQLLRQCETIKQFHKIQENTSSMSGSQKNSGQNIKLKTPLKSQAKKHTYKRGKNTYKGLKENPNLNAVSTNKGNKSNKKNLYMLNLERCIENEWKNVCKIKNTLSTTQQEKLVSAYDCLAARFRKICKRKVLEQMCRESRSTPKTKQKDKKEEGSTLDHDINKQRKILKEVIEEAHLKEKAFVKQEIDKIKMQCLKKVYEEQTPKQKENCKGKQKEEEKLKPMKNAYRKEQLNALKDIPQTKITDNLIKTRQDETLINNLKKKSLRRNSQASFSFNKKQKTLNAMKKRENNDFHYKCYEKKNKEKEEALRKKCEEEAHQKKSEEEALTIKYAGEALRNKCEEILKKNYAEEALRKKCKEEALKKKCAEEALQKKCEEEALKKKCKKEALRKKCEEKALRKKCKKEALRKKCEEKALKKKCAEDALRKKCEEKALRKRCAEEALRKKCEEKALRKRCAEEALRKKCEEKALRKKCAEEALRKKCKEEALRKKCSEDELQRKRKEDALKNEAIKRATQNKCKIQVEKRKEDIIKKRIQQENMIKEKTLQNMSKRNERMKKWENLKRKKENDEKIMKEMCEKKKQAEALKKEAEKRAVQKTCKAQIEKRKEDTIKKRLQLEKIRKEKAFQNMCERKDRLKKWKDQGKHKKMEEKKLRKMCYEQELKKECENQQKREEEKRIRLQLEKALQKKTKKFCSCLYKTLGAQDIQQGSKVSIIGSGAVGMSSAITLLLKGVTNNILLYDTRKDLCDAERLDLLHGSLFLNNLRIEKAKCIECTKNSKVVVVTAGPRQKPKESRLEITNKATDIIKKVMPELVKHSPRAVFIIVADPADAMTWLARKVTDLPYERCFSPGCYLDSARFRMFIAQILRVSTNSVQGYIIGEQGDSCVPLWSTVTVGGTPLVSILPDMGTDTDPMLWSNVHKDVVDSSNTVIRGKGYTNWAIGLAVADIISAIFKDCNRIIPLSTNAKGMCDIQDEVFLSLPCIVNKWGLGGVIYPQLSQWEHDKLMKSVEKLLKTQREVKL